MVSSETAGKLSVSAIVSLIPIVVGTIVGIFGNGGEASREWYDRLEKPIYSPPPLTFSIVWPILYILIGGAFFLSCFNQEWITIVALIAALALNLLFNFSFTFLMFRSRELLYASLVTWMTLATALILIVAMMSLPDPSKYPLDYRWWMECGPVWMLAPYVAWLVLASMLSSDVFLKNSQDEYEKFD